MEEQNLQSLTTVEEWFVDGIYLPKIPTEATDWEEKLRQLRQMKLRDDDIFLFTYPKSGTNWLWEVITMLRKGQAEYNKNSKMQLMMDAVHVEKLKEMPSPRTLNTHLPVSMLPVAEMKARRLKTVHVYRNPKDTCVLMFNMVKASGWTGGVPTDTFHDFFENYFFTEKQTYGPYFRHLRQMHEFQQQNPEVPSLSLSFEDTKKDPVGCVKKLAQFLYLTVSDELCAQIAQACSFDSMKKKEAEKATPDYGVDEITDRLNRYPAVIYRKGQIGDWKNYFTVAMDERVNDLIKHEMKDLPFTLTYE